MPDNQEVNRAIVFDPLKSIYRLKTGILSRSCCWVHWSRVCRSTYPRLCWHWILDQSFVGRDCDCFLYFDFIWQSPTSPELPILHRRCGMRVHDFPAWDDTRIDDTPNTFESRSQTAVYRSLWSC